MKHATIRVILLIIILGALYFFLVAEREEEATSPVDDEVSEEAFLKNEEVGNKMEGVPEESRLFEGDFLEVPFTFEGILEDVTGGEAMGFARAGYKEKISETQPGMYMLEVDFENLPKLEENFFYEGWVVRKSPFAFISTGALRKHADGHDINIFASRTDYTPYDFYVLTLEPDDGDPAPAEHILEGELKSFN